MRTARLIAALATAGLVLTACGGVNDSGTNDATDDDASPTATAGATGTTDDAPDTGDDTPEGTSGDTGGSVTVAGFNFPESSILMEIYAGGLEGAGLDVTRQADVGTRELVLPEVKGGNIDIVPEYLGSLISAGYGETPENEPEAALDQASDLVSADGLTLLEPAGAQNKNVFVVTTEWAEDNDVTSLADLADVGEVTLAGPPECEDRDTCFMGLSSVYGLDNVSFTPIGEKPPRLGALEQGDAQMILLFSTDPVFADGELTILDDPENLSPPENVIPLVRQDALDANPVISETLDEVSAALTTESLTELNAQASQGDQPGDIATGWLENNNLAG